MTSMASFLTDPRRGGPIGAFLSERHLWGYVPRPAAKAPGGVRRVAMSFDLDYQADSDVLVPLAELLAEEGCGATFFCIGALVERDPAPYAAAAAMGFEFGNHTQNHPDNPVLCPDREFWDLTEDEMLGEIVSCQDSVEAATGQRPKGFRSPHFKDAPQLLRALSRVPEMAWLSTTLASRAPVPTPYRPAATPSAGRFSLNFPAASDDARSDLLMVPLSTCPGVRWSPFCSYTSIRRPADPANGAGIHDVPTWVRLWDDLLARDDEMGFVSVYFDPMDVMRDEETRGAFRRMLRTGREAGWKIGPVGDVAAQWGTAV